MNDDPMERKLNERLGNLTIWFSVLLIGALIVAFILEPPPISLGVLGDVPAFSMVDSTGKKFGNDDLKGKVWVADFMYVHCTTQCPLMTHAMEKVQEHWKGKGVHFVSFTMDPSDTPQELAKYAKDYGADPSTWSFLTGKSEDVTRLAKNGFKLAASQENSDFIHSIRFTLVDKKGRIRGYYNSDDEDSLRKLNRDLWVLLAERT